MKSSSLKAFLKEQFKSWIALSSLFHKVYATRNLNQYKLPILNCSGPVLFLLLCSKIRRIWNGKKSSSKCIRIKIDLGTSILSSIIGNFTIRSREPSEVVEWFPNDNMLQYLLYSGDTKEVMEASLWQTGGKSREYKCCHLYTKTLWKVSHIMSILLCNEEW